MIRNLQNHLNLKLKRIRIRIKNSEYSIKMYYNNATFNTLRQSF